MPIPASSGIRRKITLAFAAACVTIVAFTAVVIQFQLDGVDRGARLEAGNLAKMVAYSALDDEHLQGTKGHARESVRGRGERASCVWGDVVEPLS